MTRLWLAALALLGGAGAALPAGLTCNDPVFSVSADAPALAERGCEAAALAQDTLNACGFAIERPVAIEIREALSLEDCLGIYHCDEDRIEVLSPRALSRQLGDGPFSAIDHDAYWSSIVVHEVAHAAYDTVPCPYGSCIGTAEYFAYTMQIRSLPEAERTAFEQAVSVAGQVSRDQISGLVAMMAPDRFAGLAWAHLSQRPDACGYLGLIMDGRIYLDSERP